MFRWMLFGPLDLLGFIVLILYNLIFFPAPNLEIISSVILLNFYIFRGISGMKPDIKTGRAGYLASRMLGAP